MTAAELAQACKIIDAAITVRNGLAELPRHARPLVRELVAQPTVVTNWSGPLDRPPRSRTVGVLVSKDDHPAAAVPAR